MKTKRILALVLSVLMVLTLVPTMAFAEEQAGFDNFKAVKTYTDGQFTDVKSTDWFSENLKSDYEFGLMVGRSETEFAPEENMTVAEAMTIAARLNSIYYTGKAEFAVSDPWYKVYTDYCKENGIADIANYDPNADITRGQFAEIFAKALPEEALAQINEIANGAIPDVKEGDKFSEAIYFLYRAGILVGNDDKGTFASNTNIKRMEVTAITGRMAVPSQRQKITLKTEGAEYSVSFDLGYDNKTLDSIKVKDGEKATAPATPLRSGYTFAGWYTEKTGGAKFDFNKVITADAVLYAHWNKRSGGGGSTSKKYTVTFNLNGITGTAPTAQTIEKGGKTAKPMENLPTLEDHTLQWFTKDASDKLSVWDFDNDTVTANMTLYAYWTRTLESILSTDTSFPKSDSDKAPENAWVNGTNKVFIGVNMSRNLFVLKAEEKTLYCDLDSEFTKIDETYVGDVDVYGVRYVLTCNMTDDKITSIAFNGTGTDFDVLNGTYEPASATITVADLMATQTGFPDTAASGWVNDNGYKMYYACDEDDGFYYLFTIGDGGAGFWLCESNELTETQDGYEYSCDVGGYAYTVTFVMDGDTLTAVTIDDGSGYVSTGTYTAPAAPAPTISNIADVLATVEGGFPQGTGGMKDCPDDAWVNNSDRYTFVIQSGQSSALSFYYSEYVNPSTGEVTGNATPVLTTTGVIAGENCYTATFNTITLTFNITDGKLTGIVFSSTNEGTQNNYGGTYEPTCSVSSTYLIKILSGASGSYDYELYKMINEKYIKIASLRANFADPVSAGKYYHTNSTGGFDDPGKLTECKAVANHTLSESATVAEIISTSAEYSPEYPDRWQLNDFESTPYGFVYIADTNLTFDRGEGDKDTVALAAILTKNNDNNWEYADDDKTITFCMANGSLTGIVYAAKETAYEKYNGNYNDSCFPAGTQIQYDLSGNTKNIEDFRTGDTIVSYNIETGEFYLAEVRQLVVHDGAEKATVLADVTLEDGTSVTMTPNHPVYTTDGFKAINNDKHPELKVGDVVITASGKSKVKSINVYNCEPTAVYNLKLHDFDEVIDDDTNDTYIANGIVVHNAK